MVIDNTLFTVLVTIMILPYPFMLAACVYLAVAKVASADKN